MAKAGLVELEALGFVVDMRYATERNFIGHVLYSGYGAYLRSESAEKLLAAEGLLLEQGFRLVVLDAYRPRRYQQVLWDAVEDKQYVANPKNASRHNRGGAVDVTLALVTGELCDMPSNYDEFTERAHRDYKSASDTQKRHSVMLTRAMTEAGFTTISNEWWHFDDLDWRDFDVLDVDFQ